MSDKPLTNPAETYRPVDFDQSGMFETESFARFERSLQSALAKLITRWAPYAAPRAARTEPIAILRGIRPPQS